MKDVILKYYEKIYGENKNRNSVFGRPEKELTKFMESSDIKNAKILDLGCGDGRNTLFLASKNHEVFGIDNSAHGLKLLRNRIKNSIIDKNIHLIRKNLKTLKLKQKDYFDVVICAYTFHEIGINGVKNIIKQAKLSTKLGGIVYFIFFINKDGTYMRKECYYPRNENAILRHFRGWKIIRKRKSLISQSHKTTESQEKPVRHKHYVCHLFLQKPKD